MKKTILSKILSTNFIILISALLATMLLISLLYGQVLLSQQKSILLDVADEISIIADSEGLSSDGLQGEINRMGRLAHAKIYLIRLNEETKASLLGSLDKDTLSPFIQEDLKLILLGNEVYRSLQFSKFFSAYTVFLGRPLLNENDVIGVVLIFKPLSELPQGILLIGAIFALVMLGVLVVGYGLIRWSTKRITSPLVQLSKAASEIASGDPVADVPVVNPDEIGELTVVFNAMKNRLENLAQEKNAFIAMVSHDIKTPLMSINGYIEAILDQVIPEEEILPTMDRVYHEIRRLTRLTQGLLSVSKSRDMSFKMRLEIFDVVELIHRAIDGMKHYNKKQVQIEFDCPHPIMVKADPDKLMQVIGNLLSNSIKFSRPECFIKIECTVDSGYLLHLTVTDNGVGIPEEQLHKVFEPEVRLNKGIQGEGLGLAITKKLIEMHGGSIEVCSEVNVFTTFSIDMPIVLEENP